MPGFVMAMTRTRASAVAGAAAASTTSMRADDRITNTALIDRCRRLAVPPAWTDVWISPRANSHIQATGRDARGRKQYRYHLDWRAVRDRTKFENMSAFGDLPERIPGACAYRVGAR